VIKFGEIIDETLYGPRKRSVNPVAELYGPGPEGAKCKHCKLLIAKEYARIYFKCKLRNNTNGPTTDHRANWPACGRFERDTE